MQIIRQREFSSTKCKLIPLIIPKAMGHATASCFSTVPEATMELVPRAHLRVAFRIAQIRVDLRSRERSLL
jgi:hypothetical protein